MRTAFFSFLICAFIQVPRLVADPTPEAPTGTSIQKLEDLILISDIDDTINLTRIKARGKVWTTLVNVLRFHDAFIAMPMLFTIVAAEGAQVQYLSGMPEMIGWLAQRFLQTTQFPQGPIILRRTYPGSIAAHKIKHITRILLENPTKRILLLGDNGEGDGEIYQQITSDPRFADRVVGTYIRILYNDPYGHLLKDKQIAFHTTAELAIDLYDKNMIGAHQLLLILRTVEEGLISRFRSMRNRSYPYFSTPPRSASQSLLAREAIETDPELARLMRSIARAYRKRIVEPDSFWSLSWLRTASMKRTCSRKLEIAAKSFG